MRQKKGLPSTGWCPWSNVCAGVLVQQPGKAETVGQMSTLHNSSRKMNLVRLANYHSVKEDLTMSAGRLMDTLRLSLKVTSSWMIHEVSHFDWFESYHNTTLEVFRLTGNTEKKQYIEIVKQQMFPCFFVCVTKSICMFKLQKMCILVIAGACAVSNKGMSHGFRIPVSVSQGQRQWQSLRHSSFFPHFCLFVSELLWKAWMFCKSGYFGYLLIL